LGKFTRSYDISPKRWAKLLIICFAAQRWGIKAASRPKMGHKSSKPPKDGA